MKKLVYTIITILFLSPISAQVLSTTVARSDGKVKNEPTIFADIIGTVSKGDSISIMGYEDNYWKIQKDTLTGYMSEVFLDVNDRMKEIQKDAQYHANIEKYGESIARKIKSHSFWKGMTKEMARQSLGAPDDVNVSSGSWGRHEQWVYDYRKLYLYFEENIMTSYQH